MRVSRSLRRRLIFSLRAGYVFCGMLLLSSAVVVIAESVTSVSIVPDLNITRFESYTIQSEITGSPTSVSVEVSGVNGDGVADWDYYVDGTAASASVTKTMTYNAGEGKWISTAVYPDSIYPEVFFAPSSVTWSNAPSSMIMRRNNYHLLHFDNPFTMTGSMSFFVEVNAVPRSAVNSAEMDVYLVGSGKTISFFNSDWRNSADVELIAAFNKSATYNHEHSVNSSHHLIPLRTNTGAALGTIGDKNIDVSGDFWVILYVNSPNDARGWDLKYHGTSLCTSTDRWYVGSQAGWTTTAQSGCPDAHIHVARRAATHLDGVKAIVTAQYAGGETATLTDTFTFATPVNLAPSATSFISPVPYGVYDGGATETLTISWNPALDANDGDTLTYTITLLSSTGGSIAPALATATGATSFEWSISAFEGTYGLKGEVCDDAPSPLCTEFLLDGTFTIDKVDPIYSLSSVTLVSNNALDTGMATAGDTVTLSFSATGEISPTVVIYSGGQEATNTITLTNSGNDWTATYVVSASDTDGIIDFSITADHLDYLYADTTDDSYVIVDVTAPDAPAASPVAGEYSTVLSVRLASEGAAEIRYSTDGSIPTCTSGSLYSSAIAVTVSTVVRAVACDALLNASDTATFTYTITPSSVQTSGGRRGSTDTMSVRMLQRREKRIAAYADDSATGGSVTHASFSTAQQDRQSSLADVAARRNLLLVSIDGNRLLFRDVPVSAWFARYVSFVVEEGIAQGYRNTDGQLKGEFGVSNPVTRAEALKMALAVRGEAMQEGPLRNRSAKGTWASAYVAQAEAMNLSIFTPALDVHRPATRGEVIQIIAESLGLSVDPHSTSVFDDVPATHPYNYAIAMAAFLNLIEGDTDDYGNPLNRFRPDDPINRAEVAKIITRAKKLPQ